jgi:hypothetical protein
VKSCDWSEENKCRMILNSCRLFVACNFQTGENKIKLLVEYEDVNQNVLLLIDSILKNGKQLQHARLCFVVSGLKIIGHGNPHNNFESYWYS